MFYGKCGGSNLAVERMLVRLRKKLDVQKEQIHVCYEAGPTGFVLARRLLQIGYDLIVVAPSKIPKKSGDKVKTDRKDALKLARLHRSGELEGIHIPGALCEAIRDVCRARTDASIARRKSKQQLCAFLLRNGRNYDGRTNWTQSHMNYLRHMTMPTPAQAIVLEHYIEAVDAAAERTARLEEQMEKLLETWDREPMVRAVMAMRGFQVVAAMTIVAELGDLWRFKSPRQLMGYLGLVPGEDSSGGRRRQGAITKCGNGHARWMLVECAQHYHLEPKVSGALSRRQTGLSRAVKRLGWRAQTRLNKRFAALSARRMVRGKVIVAVARELAAFLWELDALVRKEQAAAAA